MNMTLADFWQYQCLHFTVLTILWFSPMSMGRHRRILGIVWLQISPLSWQRQWKNFRCGFWALFDFKFCYCRDKDSDEISADVHDMTSADFGHCLTSNFAIIIIKTVAKFLPMTRIWHRRILGVVWLKIPPLSSWRHSWISNVISIHRCFLCDCELFCDVFCFRFAYDLRVV